jgi:hypothetical protein
MTPVTERQLNVAWEVLENSNVVLQQQVAERDATIAEHEATLAAANDQIARLQAEVQRLSAMLPSAVATQNVIVPSEPESRVIEDGFTTVTDGNGSGAVRPSMAVV